MGTRAMNVEAADLPPLRQNRMAHAAEVLGIIRRQRLRQEEMAVVVTYDVFDRGFGGGVRVVRDLILQAILR